MQPKVVDLNTLVSGMEKMLRRLIGEDIELLSHLAPEASYVEAAHNGPGGGHRS